MASYVTPRKNTAFVFYVALEDQANAGLFKTAPTLAAGDFKVSIDGGALANLTDLPTVTPSGGRMVKVALTASEMDGDNITVVASDASGAEWYDLVVNIQTSAQQVDDLATAAALATVDGIVDALALVAPDNKPTVAITGEASANVTLWKDQTAPDAPPSKAELDALETHGDATWATADVSALATAAALATVDGIVDAIKLKTDLISADGSVSVTAAISGSTITILRGDSLSVAIAGLGDISTRSKLWFTAKQDTGDADTSAIIQLEETDGLVRLNGAAGTAVLGEITVTDEDAGDITITLDETATVDLTPRRNMSYDVQVLTATGTVTTLTSGTLHVTADVTRAVA